MNANEMFLELGFELVKEIRNHAYIKYVYRKKYAGYAGTSYREIIICDGTFAKYVKTRFIDEKGYEEASISDLRTLRCINKKIEELGWKM